MGEVFAALTKRIRNAKALYSGNYAFPCPKLSKNQKKEKGLHQKLKSFCPRNKKKKKRSSPQFGTKFGRNLRDLFVMPGPFLSIQPELKPQRRDAESRLGDANSRWGDESPLYNL